MSEWLLGPDVTYLNHGAFGVLPVVVDEAVTELRRIIERDPVDLLVRRLPAMIDEAREAVCELLHADPAGAVFVPNATSGTATVLASIPWQPGDEIVITDHVYGAVGIQVQRLASAAGVVVRHVSVALPPESDASIVDALLEAVTERTRLIVIDAIASPTGMVFPVPAIVAASHERGVPVLVDAAHAPGQIHVDLDATQPDFWVGNLHKWVCSPRAAAVMWVATQWRSAVQPLVASHEFDGGFHAAFEWTGTYDPTPILGVPAALAFWQTQGGWDVVRRRQRSLVTAGADLLAAALGTSVGVSGEYAAAMRIVRLPVVLSHDEGIELSARLVELHQIEAVVTSFGGASWMRVCGQVYNTPSDYERLASVLPSMLGR